MLDAIYTALAAIAAVVGAILVFIAYLFVIALVWTLIFLFVCVILKLFGIDLLNALGL